MNIFYLDTDPKKAAAYACDKHVVKMVTETAQLLSTCVKSINKNAEGYYKATHVNHPCSKWLRESAHNYMWLCLYGIFLCNEYKKRYKKEHKSEEIIVNAVLEKVPLSDRKMTLPPLAMPDYCKLGNSSHEEVVQSYRNYYMLEKKRFATWKFTQTPDWFK